MYCSILTDRLKIRQPQLSDVEQLASFEERNRHFWQDYINSAVVSPQEKLARWLKEMEEGRAYRFFLCLRNDSLIIGQCNFSQIVRGFFQACYLGYMIDADYQGKGLMTEAISALIPFIFYEVKLHRIVANYQPTNSRSAALLRRLGFEIEGYAKNDLMIDGLWKDHILSALSLERWEKWPVPFCTARSAENLKNKD